MPASEPKVQALADAAGAFLVTSRAVQILQRRVNRQSDQNAEQAWAPEFRDSFILLGRQSKSIEVMPTDKRLIEFRDSIEKAALHAIRHSRPRRQSVANKLERFKQLHQQEHDAFGSEIGKALLGLTPEMTSHHPSHWDAAMDSIRFVQSRAARNQSGGFVESRVALETLLATNFWFRVDAHFQIDIPEPTVEL